MAAEKAAAEAAEAARVAAEEARARAEALRPDREKLLAVAKLISQIEMPTVSAGAAAAAKQVRQVLTNASVKIQSIATSMSSVEV